MNLNSYPRYTYSGLEWIGEIPEEWEVHKIKHISNVRISNVDKKTKENEPDVLLCNYVDVYKNEFITSELDFMKATASYEQINKFKLHQDDVIITKDSEDQIDIAVPVLVNEKLTGIVCGYHLAIMTPNEKKITGRYLFRILQSKKINNQFVIEAHGVTRFGLSTYPILNSYVLVPPLPIQSVIATFLDRKTAQIDDLISKNKRLIVLLQEKRTSLINHTVTKGLDPNVNMKDSGVEWIGEIPEGWEVKRLKIITNIKYGLGQPPQALDDGIPIIRATNVKKGKIDDNNLLYIDPSDVPYERDPILKENDIIVVRSGAYTGDSAIIPKEYNGCIAGYDMVVRVIKMNPKFISYCLLSIYVLNHQIDLCRLRAAQPHLNAEELGESLIICPNDYEQNKIVDFLDKKTTQIDKTVKAVERKIELLEEYRKSLIHHVVTGKVDVRGIEA